MSTVNDDNFKKVVRDTQTLLDSVSPTMCSAKWLQSTTTLYNGMTHSCHHPIPHKINVEDIQRSPRGLHNTPTKIHARQDMLKGIQTKECDYCWKIENLSTFVVSDRIYKSSDLWALPNFQKIKDSGLGENINPTYLEIAFENVCNFKCMYCQPPTSSRWMDEVVQHGPYKLPGYNMYDVAEMKYNNQFPIHAKEYNPYIDAFWKWWPDLYNDLHTFRITGGEPLLSDNTWKVFDYILSNERNDLAFAINTNMGVPSFLVDKLIEKTNQLMSRNKVTHFEVFTSAEAFGKPSEYIRYGMDWDLFTSNVERFLANTDDRVKLSFMVTTNMLSYSSFTEFLDYILSLRVKFNRVVSHNRIPIMIAYLRWPNFMAMTQLPNEIKKQKSEEWINYAVNNRQNPIGRLYAEEVDQVRRLCDFMNSSEANEILKANFYAFFTEYDIRRKTNLIETFPGLKDYMEGSKH